MSNNVEAIYPLSPVQQGMLFHSLYEADSSVYVGQYSGTLEGQLDLRSFEQAWQRVVERHTILRTAFAWKGLAEPAQAVGVRARLPFESLDWRGLDPAAQQARWREFLAADLRRGFDISRAPLMRVTVAAVSDDVHHFVWTSHHLVIDGWSRQVILSELFALYEALARGGEARLPPARPYREFVAWLGRQDAGGAEAFWRAALRGVAGPTDLPVMHTATTPEGGGAQESERGAQLSEEFTSALREFARRHRLTPNTLLQGVWAWLLSSYSGTDDVVFGTVLPGRPPELAGAETMVGLFMNTLPVRARVPGGASPLAVLKELQAFQLELLQHQHTSLAKLREWTDVPPSLPLFETVVAFQNYPVADPIRKLGLNLRLTSLQGSQATNYPLVLRAGVNGRLWLRISYHTSRFADDAVERMLGHYRVLLERLVGGGERPVSSISLLTEQEHRRAVFEWNDTAAEYPRGLCLHELFERRAADAPDAVALVCGDQTLTYAELNRRANKLAHHLRRRGVKPNSPVGICVERSVEMVVGLLGITKAGGAYVPLDPSYPSERLSFMLEDTRVAVLLTQLRFLDGLPAGDAEIICLDRDWAAVEPESEENPQGGASAEDLVYIIYTSGSTGRPKGVMLDHRGRVNNFFDFNRRFRIGRDDRVFAVSSLSFDMSAYDVFGTLMSGGAIVVPEASVGRDPAAWAEAMRRHRVTVWHSAPALLEMLVGYLENRPDETPRDLRLTLLGGDWIPVSMPDRLRALIGGVQIISLGGATEASMDSTIYPVGPRDPNWKSIPYGRPMDNQRCYVLDAHLNPAPVGVPGELHLGGVGLAWGYLNRPGLTAERFIPDGLSGEAGGRLYKTGDLARHLPDGNLELLGRIDNQVKVRGFRVELGEIEAALRKLDGVRECLVIPRRDAAGDQRLTAYVIPEGGGGASAAGLRAALRERLPDYMVPAFFVLLDKFPLSPNGKIDRRNLPDPAQAASAPAAFAAPRNPLEEEIARKWREVLGVERVGIDDNFFELGGDSLKAMRASYVNSAYIPIIDLYQNPTVRELAQHLSRGEASRRRFVYELTAGRGEEALRLVCVPYGGGNVVAYQPLADALPGSVALYSLALPGHDFSRKDEPLRPVGEAAELCVAEILSEVKGRVAVYGHCSGSVLAVEIARRLEEAGVAVEALILGASLARPPKGEGEPHYSNPLLNYSDAELHEFLKTLDAFHEIPASELGFVMESVRHDSRGVEDYFRAAHAAGGPKLRAPIFSVIGESDPLTPHYARRYEMWKIFSDRVSLHTVGGGGHYFLKHQAARLAQIITSIIDHDAASDGTTPQRGD